MSRSSKTVIEIDKCHYCGQEYHPMRVYIRASSDRIGVQRRYVCDLAIVRGENNRIERIEPRSECVDQAIADGWIYSERLTPKR